MNPDLNAAVNQANQNKASSANLLSGQDSRGNEFLGKLGSYVANTPSTSVMAERIGKELNLPTLQENATSINQTLRNLPATYSKATTGFDVNANQLARLVGTKQTEIAPSAQMATEQAQNAQNLVNQRLGYSQADFERGLIPLSAEQNFLAERNARETTLYSQDNQNELDAIINKINTGVQISEAEKNRALQLSMQEKEFENAKKLNEQSYNQKKDFLSYSMSQDPLGLFGA